MVEFLSFIKEENKKAKIRVFEIRTNNLKSIEEVKICFHLIHHSI